MQTWKSQLHDLSWSVHWKSEDYSDISLIISSVQKPTAMQLYHTLQKYAAVLPQL